MSVAFYESEGVNQVILFRLCVKCGKIIRFNEICECENARDAGGKKDVAERPLWRRHHQRRS